MKKKQFFVLKFTLLINLFVLIFNTLCFSLLDTDLVLF